MSQAFIQAVLNRLPPIEPNELWAVLRAIEDLRRRGWTKDEAADKLRWMEHVNPDVDEDTALRRMREVEDRVRARRPEPVDVTVVDR